MRKPRWHSIHGNRLLVCLGWVIAVTPVGLAAAGEKIQKRDSGVVTSGSAEAIRFAVAWASGPRPAVTASKATRDAIQALGCPAKAIVFLQAYSEEAKARAAGRAVHRAAGGVDNVGVYAEPLVNGGHLPNDAVAVLAVGGKQARCKAFRAKLDKDRARLGRLVAGQMKDLPELKIVIALSEPNLSFEEGVTVEGFLHGVMDTLGRGVMLWGGNGKPCKDLLSWEFHNGNMTTNEVVAMGIGGPLDIVGDHRTEFLPVGKPVTVTKTEGKWVLTLDDRPAAKVYRAVRGMKDDEPFTSDSRHPVGVILGDRVYVRQVLEHDPKRDALRFIAEIPQGTRVYVLKGGDSAERIYQSARDGLKDMLRKAQDRQPLLVMVSDCCARGFRLKKFTAGKGDEVLDAWIPALGTREVPIFSLDAYGEIGHIAKEFKGLIYQYQQHSFVSLMLVVP